MSSFCKSAILHLRAPSADHLLDCKDPFPADSLPSGLVLKNAPRPKSSFSVKQLTTRDSLL